MLAPREARKRLGAQPSGRLLVQKEATECECESPSLEGRGQCQDRGGAETGKRGQSREWVCQVQGMRLFDWVLRRDLIGTVQTEAPRFEFRFNGSGVCARAKNTSGETAVRLSINQQLRYKTADLCTADKVSVEKTPFTNAGCGFLRGCYNVRL